MAAACRPVHAAPDSCVIMRRDPGRRPSSSTSSVPKGFFPQQDTGLLAPSSRRPQDISFTAMNQRQQGDRRDRQADPDVEQSSFLGGAANRARSTGADHHQPEAASASANRAPQRCSPGCAEKPPAFPASRCSCQARQDVQIGAEVSKTQYQYTLQDPDVAELFNGRQSCWPGSPRCPNSRT